ncbi:twin-arginine translocase subunit TatB [Methylovirgula ligni]|uniref:Sec-independent protein translocase protein TatB n=1 Tax=Methylovirgula ligni TaxID=569860 RepID=A0A3D9YYX5_9HYPH|nr:twin-arginine translocase TatA/TatE family subunit [Methylovirgula ligni]QAY96974.1 twin-arginine translocase subunit TatB [Methylovirgula ligni]REF87963.1 sec-independent protein translocase protein TatB [Methylovirgula ligni]
MFEFDAGKLIIIAIAALIFIGPKDLPRVMRQAGQALAKLRRMGAEFQAQFMTAMNEAGAEDLKADVNKLTESAKIDLGFDPLQTANSEIASVMRQVEAPVKTVPVEVAALPVAAVSAPEINEAAPETAPVARAANE